MYFVGVGIQFHNDDGTIIDDASIKLHMASEFAMLKQVYVFECACLCIYVRMNVCLYVHVPAGNYSIYARMAHMVGAEQGALSAAILHRSCTAIVSTVRSCRYVCV